MTKLLQMFEQRQFVQSRISITTETSATVSSSEAEDRAVFNDGLSIQETPNAVPGHNAIIQQINVNSSSDVKIGDEVHNHIHYNQLKEVKTMIKLNLQVYSN